MSRNKYWRTSSLKAFLPHQKVIDQGTSMKRRQFIQYAGFGGVGLFAGLGEDAFALRRPADPTSNAEMLEDRFENLQSFEFETVQIDRQGQEIDRQSRQARFFTVDLGNQTLLEMVAVSSGRFLMGATDGEKYSALREGPQHLVDVQPFFMGKYPVTQAQWGAVAALPKVNRDLDAHPSHFKGDRLPVESVSWLNAMEFCDRLSNLTGVSYRLPSEAEWEYACRAGSNTPFAYGETLTSQVANYGSEYAYAAEPVGDYRQATTPVGQFVPNALGLSDMHGNVWEWCADRWHETYAGAPSDGKAWLKGGNADWRSLRGGGWSDYPSRSRSAQRSGYPAEGLNRIIGFRVCTALA
jgi:formylglycine-generating enzyme required for sulfatase activity